MKAFRALVLSLAFSFAWAVCARAGVIFPPASHLASDPELTVAIFVTDKDPKTIEATDASGKKTTGELKPGFNRWKATLAPGKNVIRFGDDSREVFLEAAGSKAPEGFVAHPLHEAMDDCENCHTGEGAGTELKTEVPELCYECHENPSLGEGGAARKVVHSPVGDGDCLSCHRAHFSNQVKLLDQTAPGLCADCHDPMTADKEGKQFASQHEPVSAGDCLDCHEAHASDNGSLAKAEGGKLCANCHDDPTAGAGGKKKYLHEPVANGECGSCHKVHGSAESKLLTMPLADLCKECHDYPTTSDKGVAYANIHPPVEEADCLGCHDAHASDSVGMTLKDGPALCLECHDDPRKASKTIDFPNVHAALDDGCLPCHKPHGSDAPKLLAAPGAELCNECHDDVRLDKDGAAYASIHLPVDEGKCVDCHRAHASTVKKLLVERGNKLCLKCHVDYHPSHRSAANIPEGSGITVPEKFPMERGLDFACLGCHRPHGSQSGSLFVTESMMLCANCHHF